jgi:hypothetical protein
MVTSMPARVPSIGVSFDERIVNLLDEQGETHRVIGVSDPELGAKLLVQLRRIDQDREAIQARSASAVVSQLERMGKMGRGFADEVARVYPDHPQPRLSDAWEMWLPPLPRLVSDLLERH